MATKIKLFLYAAIIQSTLCTHSSGLRSLDHNYQSTYNGNGHGVGAAGSLECPPSYLGLLSYAMNCQMFLNCAPGVTLESRIETCPIGTLFNAERKECDYPSKVNCGLRMNPLRIQESKSAKYEIEEQPEQVFPNYGEKDSEIPHCSEGVSGLFRHPYDCSQFINCANGRSYIQKCGAGTVFNPSISVCDWPKNVKECGGIDNNNENNENFESGKSNHGEGMIDVRMDEDFHIGGQKPVMDHETPLYNRPKPRLNNPPFEMHDSYGNPINQHEYNDFSDLLQSPSNIPSQNLLPPNIEQPKSILLSPSVNIAEQQHNRVPKIYQDAFPVNRVPIPSTDILPPRKEEERNQPSVPDEIMQKPLYAWNGEELRVPRPQHYGSPQLQTPSNQISIPSTDILPPKKEQESNPSSQPNEFNQKPIYGWNGEEISRPTPRYYGSPQPRTPAYQIPIPSTNILPPKKEEESIQSSHSNEFGQKAVYGWDGKEITAVTGNSEEPQSSQIINKFRPLLHQPLNPSATYNQSERQPKTNYPININEPSREMIPPTEELRRTTMPQVTSGYSTVTNARSYPTPKFYGAERNDNSNRQPKIMQTNKNNYSRTYNPYYDQAMSTIPSDPSSQYNNQYSNNPYESNNPYLHNPLPESDNHYSRKPTSPINPYSNTPPYENASPNFGGPNPVPNNIYSSEPQSIEATTPKIKNWMNQNISVPLDAFKLLLKPYLPRDKEVDPKAMKDTDENIMKLFTTTEIPEERFPGQWSQENEFNTNDEDAYNQKPLNPDYDTELITTLEQDDLNQLDNQNPSLFPLRTTTPKSVEPPLDPSDPNFQHSPDFHNNEWQHPHHHRHSPGSHHHNRHHNHHQNHHPHHPHHGSNFHHSRDFHMRHPHIPTPNEFANDPNFPKETRYPQPNDDRIPPGYDRRDDRPSLGFPLDTDPLQKVEPPFGSLPPQKPIFNSFGECSPQEFQCDPYTCLPQFKVCDGIRDCRNKQDEDNCTEKLGYELRLTANREYNNEGLVEVKVNGNWGYICDTNFDMRDADVICKELGFPLGAEEIRMDSFYAKHINSTGNFAMEGLQCTGNESSLADCEFNGWGIHNCLSNQAVGVACKRYEMGCPMGYWMCSLSEQCIPLNFLCDEMADCTDRSDLVSATCDAPIAYRQSKHKISEGRLEVRYKGIWGTVCEDYFGPNEVKVACRSLGYIGKSEIVKQVDYSEQNSPIWLSHVKCNGSELTLDECKHMKWGDHKCTHTEDVFLHCTNEDDKPKITLSGALAHARNSRLIPHNVEVPERCGYIAELPHMDIADVVTTSNDYQGKHPWQAAIRFKDTHKRSSHICGAVLISKYHLLTTAHCIYRYNLGAYYVRLGDYNSDENEDTEMEVNIVNWYVHEDFRNSRSLLNDIALLAMRTPIYFTDFIQPICMPTRSMSVTPNKRCVISGWGSSSWEKPSSSNELQSAIVPIIDKNVCKREEIYGRNITDGMFCAGYLEGGDDACDGDSGGPLVCSENGSNILFGLISWGIDCGLANKPGVYVDVPYYLDWIEDKIAYSLENDYTK